MWKKTAEKTINTVFSAEDNYPQNRENNFVTFYNDLYIPLNSNIFVNTKAKIAVNSFACFICVVYLGYNEIEKYSNPDKRFSVYLCER